MVKSLSVCSWSLNVTDCVHLARCVHNCGLSQIQIALDPISSEQWDFQGVIETLHNSKIGICSGMMTTVGEDYSSLESIKATGGIRPDEHWEENQSNARRNAKIAHDLGIDLVTFHAGYIPEERSNERQTMIDRIKVIAEIFGGNGIRVGLETGQERAESLLDVLADPAMSGVGVNFDPANMILYNMGDPAEALELLQNHLVQVHMKDAIATRTHGTWGSEVPAGQGDVDWGHYFQFIQSLKKDLNIVIEREAGDCRIDDIVSARILAEKHGCG